jgi:hypothetical protein
MSIILSILSAAQRTYEHKNPQTTHYPPLEQ